MVVVIKFATHPALDELETSFVEKLHRLNSAITIERLNANKDAIVAKQLAEAASSRSDVALLVTLATPATQAAAKTPSGIPLLYAAVADPDGAGVVSSRTTGIQNAGRNIVAAALGSIKLMYPNATRIGTFYDPKEQNSVFVQQLIDEECRKLHLTRVERTTSDPGELPILLEQIQPAIDVLYCTNDNMVNKGVFGLARTAKNLGIPFFIGELSAVEKGPLAGVGVEYRSTGEHLAEMAASIIRNPSNPLPPREPPALPQFWLNMSTAQKLGFVPTKDFLRSVDKTIN